MYEYKVKILKVVDGDTVDVDIDLGFGVWLKNERVRIMGIDTPESRTRDLEEKKYGLLAKEYLKQLLENEVTLKTQISKNGEDMKGKFGRILGDFSTSSGNVTDLMISGFHAVRYHGQSKDDVKEAHLQNRINLQSL
jgi:micrococcal nuclease